MKLESSLAARILAVACACCAALRAAPANHEPFAHGVSGGLAANDSLAPNRAHVPHAPITPGNIADLTVTYTAKEGSPGSPADSTARLSTATTSTATPTQVSVVTPLGVAFGNTIITPGQPARSSEALTSPTGVPFPQFFTGTGSSFNVTFTRADEFAAAWNTQMFSRAIR